MRPASFKGRRFKIHENVSLCAAPARTSRGAVCLLRGEGIELEDFCFLGGAKSLVERSQIRLDPTGARLRREQALARVVFEREVLVGGRNQLVGEGDERTAFVASAFEEGADASW